MDTTEEKIFKIDITDLFPKFEEHLNIQGNSRIIFSGKFGIGKTYFLNEFFENKKDKYEIFHLYPVNYQISSNEDMVQFLKYDILIELLKKGEVFNKGNNLDKSFVNFIKDQWNTNSILKGTIKNTIELLPFGFDKLGKPLKTALEVDKKFQEFKLEGDTTEIDKFLKENNTESDVISEIIKKKIQESKKEKESVLILDDLERIDPEHIFRILNVFSAHFDLHNNELENKFGFDKIILVSDSQNLKSIFHHKYGSDTDSNGYFDKFFSIEVFQFENKEIVTNAVDQIISHFQIEDETNLKEALGESGFLRIFLKNILLNSLELSGKEKLNLRQLLKGIKFPLRAFGNGSYKKGIVEGRDQAVPQFINLSIKALVSIFGGIEADLLSVLKKVKDKLIVKKNEYGAYKEFSKYLLLTIAPFDKNAENFQLKWSNYLIDFNNKMITKIENEQRIEVNQKILFFDLLIEYVQERHYLEVVDVW